MVLLIAVRLILVFSIIFNMHTQQVDYINAFCQVPLEQTLFVEIPVGFEASNKVILLKQSVYRLRQSPLIFTNIYGKYYNQEGLLSQIMMIVCLLMVK